jgi:hypothetical protein
MGGFMIRSCLLIAVFTILILSIPLFVSAQDSLNVRCLNQYYHNWTDGVYEICVDGEYAYLACGNDGLRIIDISDSTQFSEIFHYPIEEIRSIDKSGNFIYAGSRYFLQIIDVSDPRLPVRIHTISFEHIISAIKIFGNYAFVRTDSMMIVDITDPYNAHTVSNLPTINDIAVRNDTAFVAALFQGFQFWDISDINTPRYLGGISGDSMQIAVNIYVSGNYAYLGTSGRGISVIDLSSMQVVDAHNGPTFCLRMQGVNNHIYVECIDYRSVPEFYLETVDISDPINPVITSSYGTPDSSAAFSFYVFDEKAYVACGGIRVLDISNPYQMNEYYYFNRGGLDMGVAVSGDYAYINNSCRLSIIDISDIQNPREIGNFEFDDPSIDFEIQGNIAYMLEDYINPLYAIDISTPELPVLIGGYSFSSNHYSLDIYDHYAYISEEHDIRILNISDPANITYAGHFNYSNINNLSINILTVYDRFLIYSRFDDRSINVLDLSDPVHPQQIRNFILDEYCSDAMVDDNFIYFVSQSYLWIFDVSSWNQISATQFDDYHWNDKREIEINGNYAFITSRFSGLTVIDISNPAEPQLAGYYRIPNGANGISFSNNTIILAQGSNLGFYEFTPADAIDDSSQPKIPTEFAVLPNYPNPFNNSTTIRYELPLSADVTIDIYDIAGRHIRTLLSEKQSAGYHELNWDSKSATSGIYFYKIRANDFTQTQKMVLIK